MPDRGIKQRVQRDSEERFRQVMEALDVGVAVVGPGTEALLFNDAALDLLGVTRDQLLGRSAFDPAWNIIHEDGTPFSPEEHPSAQAIATRLPVRGVVAGVFRPSQGDRKWLLCSAVPHLDADGKVSEVICSFSDITAQKDAEQMALANHEKLAKQARLLDLAHDAILVRDLEGRIIYWNEGAVKKYGWSRQEAIGKTTHQLLRTEFPEPLEEVQRKLLSEGFWEGELVHTCRAGKRLIVASRKVLDRENPGHLPVVLEINRNITELKEAERKLRESEQALRELSRYLLQTQDEERWRISRDLYDSTSQGLTGILWRLHALRKIAHAMEEPERRALAESLKLAEDTSNFIRTFSSGLHPPVLDEQGLEAAILWYAQGINAQGRMRVEIESPPELSRLPREAERSLFRIVQESITRIRLLGANPLVKISLASTAKEFVLEVREESGTTLAAASARPEAGLRALDVGVTGMQERMRQLGGWLDVRSSDSGILFRAVLPLGGASEAAPKAPA